MLKEVNGTIQEMGVLTIAGSYPSNCGSVGNYVPTTTTGYYDATNTLWFGNYPVYVCTDKTKKAIEILKALQADKQIVCKSVPKFIELVERIAGLM